MFGSLSTIAIFALAALSAGGVAYALLFPRIAQEANADKRIKTVAARPASGRQPRVMDGQNRRIRVQEALKEIEDKQKSNKKLRLRARLQQAGLDWTPRKFIVISLIVGLVAFCAAFLSGAPPLVAGGAAFAGAFGLPRWFVNFKRKRRQDAFMNEFANAVDVIVRGVKAGLPLNDCIRVVAQESQEPVRSEFRMIVESQQLGVATPEAIEKMYERVPLAEVNFFSIVVTIQQKAGGNLSETLANLSKVLRDRKKMHAKIQAMSMEAKASAVIIGALPLAVMFLVYLTTPDYIALLWQERLGHIMLAASATWMFCGVMVMRKMINFDF